MVWLATKTLAAIDAAMVADGGSKFRQLQAQSLPMMKDAYREDEDGVRSHLGASVIGNACERALWYGFRWFAKKVPTGKKHENEAQTVSRFLRLWNRGHLEEGRFLAMMWMIGVTIYQQDANGNQFKIAEYGGHFGGSGDGIGVGIPDLPFGQPGLTEYKTHSAKSFDKLVEDGVMKAKFEHYAQMQVYMYKFGLLYALYLAVNKDTDELYAEIVTFDADAGRRQLDKAGRVIFAPAAPPRIKAASPGYYICRLCDFKNVCFGTVPPQRNCRTCQFSRFREDGTVTCGKFGNLILDKAAQLEGCESYRLLEPHR